MSEPARARRKPARRRGRADALDQGAQALAAARAATHSAASGLISDEPADVDRLGRDDLSSHIATVIATLPPPFTIAVYGDWGEGKTSLLKHIRDKVRTESDDGGAGACYTVWFDLWQHQDDVNPVLAMLQMARAERDKTNTLLAKAVSKLDAVIPLMWTAMDHLPKVGWGADAGPKVEVSLAGLGSDYQRHRDARREDRMEVLDAQVRLHELFAEVLDTLAGDGRVVFFVDDLDRCLPEHVVDLLEKIRLFMNHKKCVFVLGVDEQAVENAIKEAKDYKDEEIAGRYLEKMIQYGFDLPPVDSAQRDEFVMTALRQAVGDSLSDDQIHTIVTGLWSYAFNDPEVNASVRLVVRTVNTFAVDHAIGSAKLGDDYDPRIMAVISVLKTCYREAFTKLRRRHDDRTGKLWRFFFDHDKSVSAKEATLGTLFGRKGPRWDGEEPDNYQRCGYPFVQATQVLYSEAEKASPGWAADFPRLAESHFRFADSIARKEGGVEPPERQRDEPRSCPDVDVPKTSAEEEPDFADFSPGPDTPDTPSRPVQLLAPLPGLVDYRTREPSTEADVQAACAQMAQSTVVRLSGIDWRVLEVGDDGSGRRALLLAYRVIGTGPYNKVHVAMTWARCDLRRWLNEEFMASLGSALTSRVLPWHVHNGPNPTWDTPGDDDTTDYFFLLSMEEAAKRLAGKTDVDWKQYRQSRYFGDKPDEQGLAARNEDGERSWWWLRSPGDDPVLAASVDYGGLLRGAGGHVSAAGGGVRPAFQLNLEA